MGAEMSGNAGNDTLLDMILNELDITYEDEALKKKINRIIRSGKAYLADKYGEQIDYDADAQALELLISYCRYGRSNAIEQFTHDFSCELTALALRGALEANRAAGESDGAGNEAEV